MLISNNYHLGQLGSSFILWNNIELIYLTSKNLQTARKEAEEIIKNK